LTHSQNHILSSVFRSLCRDTYKNVYIESYLQGLFLVVAVSEIKFAYPLTTGNSSFPSSVIAWKQLNNFHHKHGVLSSKNGYANSCCQYVSGDIETFLVCAHLKNNVVPDSKK
jgi:hypothetical protein